MARMGRRVHSRSRTRIEAQSGGFHENICNFGAIVRVGADRRLGSCTTGAVQRGRRDDGALASRFEGRGGEQELFLAMGGKLFNAGGKFR